MLYSIKITTKPLLDFQLCLEYILCIYDIDNATQPIIRKPDFPASITVGNTILDHMCECSRTYDKISQILESFRFRVFHSAQTKKKNYSLTTS